MLSTKSLFTFVLIALPLTATAAKKDHEWKTGTVLDTAHNRYFAGNYHNGSESGSVTNSGTYSGSSSGYDTPVYHVYETYVVDAGTIVYMAEERLRWRWSKPARLTVNGPVKYDLEGRKMYLLDEDGKEHEATVVKQTLKKPAGE